MSMPLPPNTLPMMTGTGQFGPIEMGGMFTVMKVREDLAPGDYKDPGPYKNPPGHGRSCRRERRRTAATATKPTPFSGDGDARHGYARHEGTSAQSLGAKSNPTASGQNEN